MTTPECDAIEAFYGHNGTSSVQQHGCALRAMTQPSLPFLRMELPVIINGSASTMTIASLEHVLSQFYVIGIQMRLGDVDGFGYAHPGRDMVSQLRGKRAQYFRPFRCAETLQAYLEGRPWPLDTTEHRLNRSAMARQSSLADDSFVVDGRPVVRMPLCGSSLRLTPRGASDSGGFSRRIRKRSAKPRLRSLHPSSSCSMWLQRKSPSRVGATTCPSRTP